MYEGLYVDTTEQIVGANWEAGRVVVELQQCRS